MTNSTISLLTTFGFTNTEAENIVENILNDNTIEIACQQQAARLSGMNVSKDKITADLETLRSFLETEKSRISFERELEEEAAALLASL